MRREIKNIKDAVDWGLAPDAVPVLLPVRIKR
jgi:hypothetical protein